MLQLTFNPITGNFDYIDISSTGLYFLSPVANYASLPAGDPNGATRAVLNEDALYTYNSSSLTWIFSGKIKTNIVGSSPNSNAYSVDIDNTLTLQPADGSNPGVITAGTQTIGGNKTFSNDILVSGVTQTDGGVDTSSVATLSIGTSNANVLNIGNSGATVNIQGTTIYENVSQLQVTDPLITINKGGASGSGANSGIEIEEASVITGYVETSANRNSWILKAPNTTGIATVTPGSSGITLDQSSHNPITLSAVGSTPNANGSSISGSQVLNLQPADATNPGVVTSGSQVFGGTKTFITPNLQLPVITDTTDSTKQLKVSTSGSTTGTNTTLSFSQTTNQVITIPNATDTLVGKATTDTLTNKTINPASNTINLSSAHILVGNVSNAAADVAMSGDVSITNVGSTTVNTVGTSTASNIHSAELAANAATNINTVSTIVKRDGSGDFSAGTITATLNGTATNNTLKSSGDIDETSFSAANNQASATNITGLSFNNSTVRAADILLSVLINATSSLYEYFTISVIQKASSWDISYKSVGDNSQFLFSITSAGQIQYTSGNYTGFSSATVKFRAFTLSV